MKFLPKPRNQEMKLDIRGSSITVNGTTYTGGSIHINGNQVFIDGVAQNQVLTGPISLVVNGDCGDIDSGSGDIKVTGNAGKIRTGSGNVECGNVSGNIQTGSGDVQCTTVGGNISTGSGDVYRY
jgi:hypothetical protein